MANSEANAVGLLSTFHLASFQVCLMLLTMKCRLINHTNTCKSTVRFFLTMIKPTNCIKDQSKLKLIYFFKNIIPQLLLDCNIIC